MRKINFFKAGVNGKTSVYACPEGDISKYLSSIVGNQIMISPSSLDMAVKTQGFRSDLYKEWKNHIENSEFGMVYFDLGPVQ